MKYGFILWPLVYLITSCHSNNSLMNPEQARLVKDSVSQMTANIERDISSNGPAAWLNYFEDTADFFMASDGRLALKDYQSARSFINNSLVKSLPKIILHWDHIRIDPLTTRLASLGADFNEKLTDSAGKIITADGYFTAVAEQTNNGWKLRNAHWSILKAK
jgi:hypothetical protein